jgi:hypothetical protein
LDAEENQECIQQLCKGEEKKYVFLSQWMASIVDKKPLDKLVKGVEIKGVPAEAKNHFVSSILPLLRSRKDLRVRATAVEINAHTFDLRIVLSAKAVVF